VDIGVHQDGLVHISALAGKFVKDPRDVVKAGDVVKVKVLEVDEKRQRIALTMRLDDAPGKPAAARHDRTAPGSSPARRAGGGNDRAAASAQRAPQGAMAAAFAKLKRAG